MTHEQIFTAHLALYVAKPTKALFFESAFTPFNEHIDWGNNESSFTEIIVIIKISLLIFQDTFKGKLHLKFSFREVYCWIYCRKFSFTGTHERSSKT